ncbi:hypothetical protein Pelo_264 [Pelomyxa schiedti]|nr:hypothetical protein Pelo_264 [Pelomyxa schiedti]
MPQGGRTSTRRGAGAVLVAGALWSGGAAAAGDGDEWVGGVPLDDVTNSYTAACYVSLVVACCVLGAANKCWCIHRKPRRPKHPYRSVTPPRAPISPAVPHSASKYIMGDYAGANINNPPVPGSNSPAPNQNCGNGTGGDSSAGAIGGNVVIMEKEVPINAPLLMNQNQNQNKNKNKNKKVGFWRKVRNTARFVCRKLGCTKCKCDCFEDWEWEWEFGWRVGGDNSALFGGVNSNGRKWLGWDSISSTTAVRAGASPQAELSFHSFVLAGSALRTVFFVMQIMLTENVVNLAASINFMLDTFPSIIFFSAYLVLLLLWFAPYPFVKKMFVIFNAALYLVAFIIYSWDVMQNDLWAGAGDIPTKYTVAESVLHWVLSAMYIAVSCSFLIYSYLLFKKYKKGELRMYHGKTAISSIAMVCMAIFLVRSVLMVFDSFFDFLEQWWVQPVYYTLMEVVPLVLMIIAMNTNKFNRSLVVPYVF